MMEVHHITGINREGKEFKIQYHKRRIRKFTNELQITSYCTGMRKHDSSTRRTTESTRSTTNQSELPKRRAVSQPSDPRALTQAARAKKILQQMKDEEQKIEDMRREREEEGRRPAVNG